MQDRGQQDVLAGDVALLWRKMLRVASTGPVEGCWQAVFPPLGFIWHVPLGRGTGQVRPGAQSAQHSTGHGAAQGTAWHRVQSMV